MTNTSVDLKAIITAPSIDPITLGGALLQVKQILGQECIVWLAHECHINPSTAKASFHIGQRFAGRATYSPTINKSTYALLASPSLHEDDAFAILRRLESGELAPSTKSVLNAIAFAKTDRVQQDTSRENTRPIEPVSLTPVINATPPQLIVSSAPLNLQDEALMVTDPLTTYDNVLVSTPAEKAIPNSTVTVHHEAEQQSELVSTQNRQLLEQYAERDAMNHIRGLSFEHALRCNGDIDIEQTIRLMSYKQHEYAVEESTIGARHLYGTTYNTFLRTHPDEAHTIKTKHIIDHYMTITDHYVAYLVQQKRFASIYLEHEYWLWQVCARVIVSRMMEAKLEQRRLMERKGQGNGFGFADHAVGNEMTFMMLQRELTAVAARGSHGAPLPKALDENGRIAHQEQEQHIIDLMHQKQQETMRTDQQVRLYPPLAALPLNAQRLYLIHPRDLQEAA